MKAILSRIRRRLGSNKRRLQLRVGVGLNHAWSTIGAMLAVVGRRVATAIPYVLICVFSATVPSLFVYGYRYVTHTPSFKAKRIEVEGNHRLSVTEILETAGVERSPNLLSLDLEQLEETLVSHPWIASATVTRELPDRLMIGVVEFEPAAIVALGARYLVDSKGEIFRRISPTEIFHLPTITGLVREDLDREAPHERRALAMRLVRGALSLIDSWTRNDPNNVLPISEIHPDPLFGYSVTLRGGTGPTAGAVIHLGHADVGAKMGKLAVILADAQRQNREIAEVRLDNERDPGRVAVRFRDAEQAADAQLGTTSVRTKNNRDKKAGTEKVGQKRERL